MRSGAKGFILDSVDEWQEFESKRIKAGMSAAKFCIHEGVVENSYYHFKRLLGLTCRPTKKAEGSFTEVSRNTPTWAIEVTVPTSGIVIKIRG